jgi:hypothetical protein
MIKPYRLEIFGSFIRAACEQRLRREQWWYCECGGQVDSERDMAGDTGAEFGKQPLSAALILGKRG